MAKIFLILSVTLALQLCIDAAPNSDVQPLDTVGQSTKIENAASKSNNNPYDVSEAAKITDVKNPQGQRQKRFNDYFDFGFTSYDQSQYDPYYVKRDDSQNTGVYGAQDTMAQIFRRVQAILNYTRRQALYPPVSHFPVSSFIPLFYIPHQGCDCTPVEKPNDEESSNDARSTPPTTTTPPADSTTQPIFSNEPDTSPTDDTNKTTPDLFSRLPEINEEGDGSRPISFVPIRPKTPLSRPPPPVEHGSEQAGLENNVNQITTFRPASTTTFRPVVVGLPPQADLPTNSVPTLCDGAVLSCCHRPEVTYNCFLAQGCPYPTIPENPCNESLILSVINKFQNYYANNRQKF